MAKIGLQLYTLKDVMEKDFFGPIRKTAEMGYEGVEFAGGLLDSVSAAELKNVLGETGLEVAGAVFSLPELESRMKDIIDCCRTIECPTVIFPWINDEYRTVGGYEKIAGMLNSFGRILKEHDIRFLYHIHGYEFDSLGETNGMKLLLDVLNPEYVNLEVDVYWVEWAGIDSVAFMKEYGHRSPSIHFKDMKDKAGKQDTEVGDGVIDMAAIASEGRKNNVEWFIVEQEQFEMPPLESAAVSLKNLRKICTITG